MSILEVRAPEQQRAVQGGREERGRRREDRQREAILWRFWAPLGRLPTSPERGKRKEVKFGTLLSSGGITSEVRQ